MIIRVWLIVERSWPTKPAECQVVPSVRSCCSSTHDVAQAEPRQVVGDARPADAAADHDALGFGGDHSGIQHGAVTRAVIFDFNGTISDDEPVLDRLFCAMAADLGVPMTSETTTATSPGCPTSRSCGGSSSEQRGRARTSMRCCARRSRATRRSSRGADDRRRRGRVRPRRRRRVPVAIASGAVREEVEHVLRLAGLLDLFAAIVTVDDVTHGKPDPEGYLLARRARSAAASPRARCSSFEDADAGCRRRRPPGCGAPRCAPRRTPAGPTSSSTGST